MAMKCYKISLHILSRFWSVKRKEVSFVIEFGYPSYEVMIIWTNRYIGITPVKFALTITAIGTVHSVQTVQMRHNKTLIFSLSLSLCWCITGF